MRPNVRRIATLASFILMLFLATTVSAAPAASNVDAEPIRVFTMLTYNTLDPNAAVVSYSHADPGRKMTETMVDNEAEFDQRLYDLPSGVNLTTDESYAELRHAEFLDLAENNPINIMVSIHGDLAALEVFALNTLGVAEIADTIAGPGVTNGMLVVQYMKHYNIAYLLGEDTYAQGRRATYPTHVGSSVSREARDVEAKGPLGLYVLIRLVIAALEEPEWNDNHYLSGETLGCLGVDWDTAFRILYRWEIFEQMVNDLGELFGQDWDVGEDIWGIIWDLIWGMTGYVDGLLGWWDW